MQQIRGQKREAHLRTRLELRNTRALTKKSSKRMEAFVAGSLSLSDWRADTGYFYVCTSLADSNLSSYRNDLNVFTNKYDNFFSKPTSNFVYNEKRKHLVTKLRAYTWTNFKRKFQNYLKLISFVTFLKIKAQNGNFSMFYTLHF